LNQSLKSLSVDYSTPARRHQWFYDISLRDEIPVFVREKKSSTSDIFGKVSNVVSGTESEMVSEQPAELRQSPSAAVLYSSGCGLRHSFKHLFTALDNRTPNGLRGDLLTLSTEFVSTTFSPSSSVGLSLRGSPLQFIKNEVQAQRHIALSNNADSFRGLTLSFAGSAGIASPLNSALYCETNGVAREWCPISER
jgi:hypothetical protein